MGDWRLREETRHRPGTYVLRCLICGAMGGSEEWAHDHAAMPRGHGIHHDRYARVRTDFWRAVPPDQSTAASVVGVTYVGSRVSALTVRVGDLLAVDGGYHAVEDLRHGPGPGSRIAILRGHPPVRLNAGRRYDARRPQQVPRLPQRR